MTEQKTRYLLALIVIASGLVYFPVTREGGFVYDDDRFIRKNSGVHSLDGITEVFWDPARMTADFDRDIYRPLRTIAFAISWASSGGSPWLFHLENFLWHGLAVLLVFHLSRRLRLDDLSALWCAGIFALHPLCSESVAWISSRGDLMAAVFILAACALVIGKRGQHRGVLFGLSLFGLGALAMLSKETGVAIPFLALGSILAFGARPSRRDILWICALFSLVAAFTLWRNHVLAQDYPSQMPFDVSSILTRSAVEARALLTRLRLMFTPYGLSIEHPIPDPFGLTGTLALFSSLILCVFVLWRTRIPSVRFGLFVFVFTMVPTSHTLFGVRSAVAERFLYLPLCGMAWIVSGLCSAFPIKRYLAILGFLLLPIAALKTLQRNDEWMNQEALFESVERVYPGTPHALHGLGAISYARGETKKAETLFRRLTEITPLEDARHLGGRFRLGQIALREGRIEDAIHWIEPILAFENRYRDLNLAWFGEALLVHADLLAQRGRYQEAAGWLQKHQAEFGDTAASWAGLGQNFERLRQFGPAETALRKAIGVEPQTGFFHQLLGMFLWRRGRLDEAEEALERALERSPSDSRVHERLNRLRREKIGS